MAKAKVDTAVENQYNQNDDDFLSTSSEDSSSAPSSDKADAHGESRVKGSNSWDKDDFNNNSWGAQNLLKAELKDPSFVLHWVRDGGAHGNTDRYLEQGYEFVTYKELKNFNKERLRNGKGIDSVVRVVEMVLMKLPKRRNELKKQWLRSQQVDPSKAAKDQFRQTAKQGGFQVIEEDEARELPSAFQN